MEGNKTCQVCFANQATHFCDCQDPPTIFCFDCSSRHTGKNSAIIHQIIPIAALGRNKDYKRKHKALMKAAAELRKNLERIDQCSRDIEDLIKGLTNYLTEYGSWWAQCLNTEKEGLSAAIEAAVLETSDCLSQNTEPHSPLAWALWTSLPQDMQIINCSVTTPDLQSLLQTCVSYQNNLQALCERSKPEDIRSKELVLVTTTSLCLFNFQASTWGRMILLKTRIQADEGSMWVILETGRVFVCGGAGKSTAYILARDGTVQVKERMQGARSLHGVFALHNVVYIFGGIRGDYEWLKTCEKYLLLNNTWSPLPPMQEGRAMFNPCMFMGVMYLCGQARSMEAFAPDTFLPCPITIPEPTACCLYVDSNLLVVNTENYILKYAVGARGQLVEQSRLQTPQVSKGQNSHPVVYRGLYFMVYAGKCVDVKVETGERASSS